jgi:hypothetical protein
MWEANSTGRATIIWKWFRIHLANEQLDHKNNHKEALKISEELVLVSDRDQYKMRTRNPTELPPRTSRITCRHPITTTQIKKRF